MQVKQIMIKKVVTVKPTTKITQVANVLTKNGFHGLPVVDSKGKVAGIITESDFFIKDIPHLYLPSYIQFLKRAEFAKRVSRKEKEKLFKITDATAKDIMTEDCFCISPNLELNDLIRIIREKRVYTIPVIDNNKKVVGIVTVADIIKLLKVVN